MGPSLNLMNLVNDYVFNDAFLQIKIKGKNSILEYFFNEIP